VDERLIIGFSPVRRIHRIGVVQYSVPILCRRRGDAEVVAVIREVDCTVRRDSYVSEKLCWGSPSQQNPSSSRPPVAAPAMRSRTHVSAFALVVY